MIDKQIEQYFESNRLKIKQTKPLEPEFEKILIKTFKKNLSQTPTKL